MAQTQDPAAEATITVWTVRADDREAIFNSLDTAMAYLRGDLGTNGTPREASVESSRMSREAYAARVELEDGGADAGGLN